MAGDIPYPVKVMGKFPKKVGSKIMEETPIHILQRHPLFLLAQFHAMFLISHLLIAVLFFKDKKVCRCRLNVFIS